MVAALGFWGLVSLAPPRNLVPAPPARPYPARILSHERGVIDPSATREGSGARKGRPDVRPAIREVRRSLAADGVPATARPPAAAIEGMSPQANPVLLVVRDARVSAAVKREPVPKVAVARAPQGCL